MDFKKDEKGNGMQTLSLFCQCTYCDKCSIIDAEIKQWGKIVGFPIADTQINPNERLDETTPFNEEQSLKEIPAMTELLGENYEEEIAYVEEDSEPVTAEMYYTPNNINDINNF